MKRVLIVDDEKIVLEVLQRILMRLGYETETTDTGIGALIQFRTRSYDLVLMDVLMPEKNGFEIAKEMRKMNPNQRIVLVTGIGEDAVLAQADSENIGVENVLSKPFSYEKVKSIIEEALQSKDSPVEEDVTLA